MSAIEQEPAWKAAAVAGCVVMAAACLWLFLPVVEGYFISDDFVPLALFAHWQDQGTFASHVLSKLWSGLDAEPNHFYRPLSYLTFALNYVTSGAHAWPWMSVNVVLHLLSGALVGRLGVRLAAPVSRWQGIAAGTLGATFFLFAAPGAEVVAWISGRFDACATFFTLLACYLFVSSRAPRDKAWWGAVAAGVAAVLSKESSAIMPTAILAIAWARPAMAALAWKTRVMRSFRDAAPWLVIAALYLLGRRLMFGTMMQVYAGSQPLSAMFSVEHWSDIASLLPDWLSGHFTPARRIPILVGLTLLQLVLFTLVRRPARDAALAMVAIVVLSLVLVLPHVDQFGAGIIGGRLFYQSFAFYGVLVAVALCHARLAYMLWGSSLGLALLHGAFMHQAVGRWETAYAQMRSLVDEIHALDRLLAPGEYGLVLVPGPLNGIPFAANAQGGLMLPPVFDPPVASHLLVQLDDEAVDIPAKVRDGVVSTLRRESVWQYMGGKRVAATPPEFPTAAYCWDPLSARLAKLRLAPFTTPEEYGGALQAAIAAGPCARHPPARSASARR